MEKIKSLLEKEEGPNQAARLAVRLGVTEPYIRMMVSGKVEPGWRLARDIEALYNKVIKNV